VKKSGKRICFVNADTYPVLSRTTGSEYIGGESVQHTLLARAFRDAGYDVSVVVKDFGQPQGEIIDDIRVWKTFRQEAGLPVLRFFHPRLTGVMKALRMADADIYYQSCASALTGFVAMFCKRHQRKFVFRVAHDTDLMPGKELIPFWRDRKIYKYGLKAADLIAVQSEIQLQLLRQNYGIDGPVIDMVVEPPSKRAHQKDIDVLWVNNFRRFKRPGLFLEVARALPNLRFTMIGGPCRGEENLYNDIVRESQLIDNIELTGPVPYAVVNEFFARASLFVNTSESEGFPNSFLQAWARGLPVVSFFDPDGLIAELDIGVSVNDLDEMTNAIATLLGNSKQLNGIGAIAEEFVRDRFSPTSIVTEYERFFQRQSL